MDLQAQLRHKDADQSQRRSLNSSVLSPMLAQSRGSDSVFMHPATSVEWHSRTQHQSVLASAPPYMHSYAIPPYGNQQGGRASVSAPVSANSSPTQLPLTGRNDAPVMAKPFRAASTSFGAGSSSSGSSGTNPTSATSLLSILPESTLQSTIEILSSKLAAAQSTALMYAGEVERVKEENRKLDEVLKQVRNEYATQARQSDATLEQLLLCKQQLYEKDGRLKEVSSVIAELEAHVQQVQRNQANAIQDSERALHDEHEKHMEAVQRLELLEMQFAEKNAIWLAKDEEIEELKMYVASLPMQPSMELKEKDAQLSVFHEELSRMASELDTERRKSQTVEDELVFQKSENERLRSDLCVLHDRVADIQSRLLRKAELSADDKELAIRELHSRVVGLESENDLLRKTLAAHLPSSAKQSASVDVLKEREALLSSVNDELVDAFKVVEQILGMVKSALESPEFSEDIAFDKAKRGAAITENAKALRTLCEKLQAFLAQRYASHLEQGCIVS
eukprot:ANDGO_07173.mRNA.1 hypothetical protein